MKKLEVYFDGAAWLWQKCSYGFLIKEGDIWLHSEYGKVPVEPERSTSNAAEHYALFKALDWLNENGLTQEEIIVYGDSKLVISQVFRGWQCKDLSLPYASIFKGNMMLIGRFTNITGKLLPREKNQQADDLSKMGLQTA